jgi:GDPmannose 4,6-dehydratase
MPRALITGVTGQDGSYLAELLLKKGYTVYGLVRRSSQPRNVVPGVEVVEGDVTDFASVLEAVKQTRPREIYNLAAQSFVRASFDAPLATWEVNATGFINVCEATLREWPAARIYQASTSEMFGGASDLCSQGFDEKSPFHPRSPYGVSKVAAHYAAMHYRDRGLEVSTGILFNHESPRRGEEFVTRKITRYIGRAVAGFDLPPLQLGATWPMRDWGFAGDYVEAMWLMLQHAKADDFVIATGEAHSVQEFLDAACEAAGVTIAVESNGNHTRPTEVPYLRGVATKATHELGWLPKTDFKSLVRMMVHEDIELARQEFAAR